MCEKNLKKFSGRKFYLWCGGETSAALFELLEKNSANLNVVFFAKNGRENNCDSIGLGFNVHCFIWSVVDYCAFYLGAISLKKINFLSNSLNSNLCFKVLFENGGKAVSFESGRLIGNLAKIVQIIDFELERNHPVRPVPNQPAAVDILQFFTGAMFGQLGKEANCERKLERIALTLWLDQVVGAAVKVADFRVDIVKPALCLANFKMAVQSLFDCSILDFE